MNGLVAGRIVYYVKTTGEILPAIIIRVHEGNRVDLKVFDDMETRDAFDEGTPWVHSVEYSESPKADTWHWIPRN